MGRSSLNLLAEQNKRIVPMKDICGNEIKAGQMVHVWWPKFAGAAENYDFLCAVVRTRGRGIKFVADDGQEFTTDYLSGIQASIAIQGSQQQAKEEERGRSLGGGDITMEELQMITRLREMGWYGSLYKKTAQLSTVKFEMPELERQG